MGHFVHVPGFTVDLGEEKGVIKQMMEAFMEIDFKGVSKMFLGWREAMLGSLCQRNSTE